MFKKLGIYVVVGAMVALASITKAATWERIYESSTPRGVCQTSDGGFAVTGFRAFILKVDSLGEIVFLNDYGQSGKEHGHAIKETFDKGLIVAGQDDRPDPGPVSAWILKTDSLGNREWEKTFYPSNGNQLTRLSDVCQTPDSGYLVIGTTERYIEPNSADDDIYLAKFDKDGNLQQEKVYDGGQSDWGSRIKYVGQEYGYSTYIVLSITRSFGPSNASRAWLIKMACQPDNSLTTLWSKVVCEGQPIDIGLTNDNGYIITGVKDNQELFLAKIDNPNNLKWQKIYDAGPDYEEMGVAVWQTDNGYMAIGTKDWNPWNSPGPAAVWLLKFDEYGDTLLTKTFSGLGIAYTHDAEPTLDRGCIIAAVTQKSANSNSYNTYLIKTDAQGNVGIEENEPINNRLSLIRVFPNPSRGTVWFETENEKEVEVTVFDILGRKIAVDKTKNGELTLRLQPGIYFWRTENRAGKIIVVK